MVQNELEHPDPILLGNIIRFSLFSWFIWREGVMKFLPLLQPLKKKPKNKGKKKPKQKKICSMQALWDREDDWGLDKKGITFGNLNSKNTLKTATCLWLRTLYKAAFAENTKVEKEKGNKMVKKKNLVPGDTITSA